MKIEPYLFFDGQADDAIAFYQKALGAQLEFRMSFAESPDPIPEGQLPPGAENQVMHATLRIGETGLMLSDGGCMSGAKLGGFALSLDWPTEAEARRAFDAVAEGGSVGMPMDKTFWSPCFGMVTDRFGVQWMISVEDERAQPVQR